LYETLKLSVPIRPRSAESESLLIKLIISKVFNDEEECSKDFLNEVTRKVNAFTVLLYKYLTKCFHKIKLLENKYKDWLSPERYISAVNGRTLSQMYQKDARKKYSKTVPDVQNWEKLKTLFRTSAQKK